MDDKAIKEAEIARLQQISESLHKWKNDNQVTKSIFSYLKQVSEDLTTHIINNAASSVPVDQKLYNYYASVAKLELITEILNIMPEQLEDLWDQQ